MTDLDEIKNILSDLKAHHLALSEVHEAHHEWVQEQIEKDRAKKEMMWEIAKSVAQWSVIGIMGGVIYYMQHGHWSA